MKRIFFFVYGAMSYLLFFATFLYYIGFLGNLFVPNPIDGPLETDVTTAFLINLGLVLLFGLQHSIMARPAFKKWLEPIIPPAIERSTYVLASSVTLALLMFYWQPLGGTVWSVDSSLGAGLLYALFALGWTILFVATFLLDHFELFGLKQVYFNLIGKEIEPSTFKTPLLYNYVRHPIYLGFFMALWATPHMTGTHLVLAIGMTGYILVGTAFEEKDLTAVFGEEYRNYRKKVPMLIPIPGKSMKIEVKTSEKLEVQES